MLCFDFNYKKKEKWKTKKKSTNVVGALSYVFSVKDDTSVILYAKYDKHFLFSMEIFVPFCVVFSSSDVT